MNEEPEPSQVVYGRPRYERHEPGIAPGPYPCANRPFGTPVTTPDGRPFVRDTNPDDDLAFWIPEPPCDGDPVYCCGIRVGTFHGERKVTEENGMLMSHGCISTVETAAMPAKLAAYIRGLKEY